jgi:putative 4-mercaptohistidine N1-methyltranferase
MQPFYESDRALAEYLLFHYGAPEQILPFAFGPKEALGFAARCVTECVNVAQLTDDARGLDLGCAVGRSTFELARFCRQVVGIDRSERFIEAASYLQANRALPFRFAEEGCLLREATATIPSEIDCRRVSFEQGDATDLRADLGQFDVVLMANLIDRLNNPERCLHRLSDLVQRRGQLIIASPYTWLEEYTPREHWLGGFERDGRPVRTFDSLRETLDTSFELVARKDLPFLIREHARKYQWSVAEASMWIRK